MGIYGKYLLPRLIELTMRESSVTECRSRIVPRASGEVLEIGIGSGLNLRFYGREVTGLRGLDPSPELLEMTRRRIADLPFPVELLRASAENIPLPDATMDTVVMTWALCSIPDPRRALAEIKRVLKPRGRLLFIEHGLAPEAEIQRWQQRLNPVWNKLSGGCNLDRRMDDLLREAGFHMLEYQVGYLKGPRLWTYTHRGAAVIGDRVEGDSRSQFRANGGNNSE
jgi:ubiquinone/menaquinone biosynthesis C-methylase UbiE